MPERNGEMVLLETLGSEPTEARRADVSFLLDLMSRAGYLVDDPSNAPMLALFGMVWSRLPLAAQHHAEYATNERLSSVAADLRQQIEDLGKALETSHAQCQAQQNEHAARLCQAVAALQEKCATAEPASAPRPRLPAGLTQRIKQLREGDWGVLLNPTTWLVVAVLLAGFVLGLFSAPGFAHLSAWLGGFQR